MHREKLLVIGDHFIRPDLMRSKLGELADNFEVIEASTPFPLEPFRDIAEVKEASGSEEQMIEILQGVSICIAHHAPLTKNVLEHVPDLRLFVVCRGGPVNANLEAATRHGVSVAYTPARNAAARDTASSKKRISMRSIAGVGPPGRFVGPGVAIVSVGSAPDGPGSCGSVAGWATLAADSRRA